MRNILFSSVRAGLRLLLQFFSNRSLTVFRTPCMDDIRFQRSHCCTLCWRWVTVAKVVTVFTVSGPKRECQSHEHRNAASIEGVEYGKGISLTWLPPQSSPSPQFDSIVFSSITPTLSDSDRNAIIALYMYLNTICTVCTQRARKSKKKKLNALTLSSHNRYPMQPSGSSSVRYYGLTLSDASMLYFADVFL